jgi:hypothetical protein
MNATVLVWSARLSSLLILSFVSPLSTQAADFVSKNGQLQQSSKAKPNGNGAAPAGQAKDTGGEKMEAKLKACLSRIPADSSRGQRLLAEQGCRKEHEVRAASHAAPEF